MVRHPTPAQVAARAAAITDGTVGPHDLDVARQMLVAEFAKADAIPTNARVEVAMLDDALGDMALALSKLRGGAAFGSSRAARDHYATLARQVEQVIFDTESWRAELASPVRAAMQAGKGAINCPLPAAAE